jgi:hypothetical protein
LRRVASSGAHYLTGILVLLPWISILPPATTNAGKCIDSIACPVSDTIKYVGSFLPSYVSKWVDSFAANPMLFVILLGSTLAMMSFSARLDVTIRDRMHAIWHPGPNGIPDADYSKLYKLHESRAYQWWLGSLRYNILPFAFGTSVLISFMFVAVSATSRVSFFVEDYRGLYCSENARIDASVQNLYSGPLTFYPSNICWPTGLLVERGANYRIVMNIADSMGSWKDDTLEADLQGNLENHSPLVGILAWPAKRYLWKNYYKPIARIRTLAGRKASQDEYVLDPTFTSLRNRYDCLVSDFTAQSSGELFLFVNDAVIYYWPDFLVGTYKNNRGKAEVFVKRIAKVGDPFVLPEKMEFTSACKEFVANQQ